MSKRQFATDYKLLACDDFKAEDIKDLHLPKRLFRIPKLNKILEIKRGNVLKLIKSKSIKWWVKVEKIEEGYDGIDQHIIGYVPSSLLVPINFDGDYVNISKINDETKYKRMPKITKKERKYFPLIHAFYGKFVTKDECKKLKTNWISSILYSWMSFYILLGFKRYLVEGDMWEPIKRDKSITLRDKYNKILESTTIKKSTKLPLFRSFLIQKKMYFISAFVLKFLQDLIKFMVPYMIRIIIEYYEKPSKTIFEGIGYCFILFFSMVLDSFLLNKYYEIVYNLSADLRCILISKIYTKMFTIDSEKFNTYPISSQSNLISVDMFRIQEAIVNANMLWSAPFQILLCFLFLWYILGVSAFAAFGALLIIIPIVIAIARLVKYLEIKQMKYKDERIKFVNAVLNGIKLVKLYAWESAFDSIIKKIRKKEISRLALLKGLASVSTIFMTLTPSLMCLASFSLFIYLNNYLDTKMAFASMAIFNILQHPILFLPETIAYVVSAKISLGRIQDYLSLPEKDRSENNLKLNETVNLEETSVEITNGEFSFTKDNTPFLRDINFKIKSNTIHIIIGSNGSGKSTMLQAILNEMYCIKGMVEVNGTLAYVPQIPWIRNTTLRNNILSDEPYNPIKYRKVLKVCHLLNDIETLPDRDFTDIGEKGVNLSGGQRQRLGLARALYCDASIFIIDDPFSALDKNIGFNIFREVMYRDGFLSGKIRIVTTHDGRLLKYADMIHIMKNGTIIKSGTYKELLNSRINLSEYISTVDKKKVKDVKMKKIYRDSVLPRDQSIKSVNEPHIMIQIEKIDKGKIDFKTYFRYISISNKWIFFFIVTSIIIFASSAVISQNVIGQYASNNITSDVSSKFYILYGSLTAIQIFFAFSANLLTAISGYISSKFYHARLCQCLFNYPLRFFESIPLGRLINAFSKEMSVVDEKIPSTICLLLRLAMTLIASLVGITVKIYYIVIPIIVLFLIYYVIQKLYMKSTLQIQRLESISRAPIISHLIDTFQGLSIINCQNDQSKYINRFDTLLDLNTVPFRMNLYCYRWLGVRLEMIATFLMLSSSLSIVLTQKSTPLSSGNVGFILNIITSITQTMSFLTRIRCDLENYIVSIEKISMFIGHQDEIDCESDKNNTKNWPQHGSVELFEFSCRYRPNLPDILTNINLKIEGGKKVGIVGRTGSGKSSLLLSLFRMIEVSGGKLEIDGVDITSIPLQTLRSSLTIIPQEIFIFDGTIRDNIDPFQKFNDTSLWSAIEKAQLKPFLSLHNEGLNYKIFENGGNLSSGEKQLICLARAILKNTKILILDEATSNIDQKTDQIIQNVIRTEFKNCTIITVAHRIDTILNYDKIVVLEKGRMVEYDSPNILLSNKKSIFYDMVHNSH